MKVDHTVKGLEELHFYLLGLERQTRMKPPNCFRSDRPCRGTKCPFAFEYGRFKGTNNHITKHGSARLRHIFYTAVRCSIHDSRKKKQQMKLLHETKVYEPSTI